MSIKAVIGVGLALGFAIGCAAAQFVVPPARAGTNPQKWEYLCFLASSSDDVMEQGNKAGAEGWEMVATVHSPSGGTKWCFKRPLP